MIKFGLPGPAAINATLLQTDATAGGRSAKTA